MKMKDHDILNKEIINCYKLERKILTPKPHPPIWIIKFNFFTIFERFRILNMR